MSYPAYPEYKDSAVEQVGSVPSHWTLCKIKHMLSFLGSGGTPDTEDDKCWADNGNGYPWVAISDMSERSYVDETFSRITEHGLKSKNLELWPWGTLVFSMYASLGHVAELRCCAAINQALLALKPEKNVCQRYLKYWFEFIKPTLIESARSNTQNNLNAYLVRNISCPRPPYHEQYKVAQFLDHETARIDALIEEQQRLIELLKEKRQAVISHAVTKGLDPDVPMKDSGVEWLGEVPAHWEVKPLKRISEIDASGSYGVDVKEGDISYPVATTAQIGKDGSFAVDRMPERGFSRADIARYKCLEGDVLVVKSSGSADNIISGKAGIVEAETPSFVFSNFLLRLRPLNSECLAKFLYFLVVSHVTSERVKWMCATTTYPNLQVGAYVAMHLPVPSLDEQEKILCFVEDEMERINSLIDEVGTSLELLRERRSALISAAVTGKIDVRDWTPPASSAEPEHEGEGAVT